MVIVALALGQPCSRCQETEAEDASDVTAQPSLPDGASGTTKAEPNTPSSDLTRTISPSPSNRSGAVGDRSGQPNPRPRGGNGPAPRDAGNRPDRSSFRGDRSRGGNPRFGTRRGPDVSGPASSAAEGNGTNTTGYAAFRMVGDRNIFDPFRTPRSARSVREDRRPARVDSFTLVGTLSYEKGDYAFFDGSSSDYRKALSVGQTLAGYRLAQISSDAAELVSGTNTVQLQVGMQMRREDEGWHVQGSRRPTLTVTADSSSAATGLSSADENDVIKRLMQQREAELK